MVRVGGILKLLKEECMGLLGCNFNKKIRYSYFASVFIAGVFFVAGPIAPIVYDTHRRVVRVGTLFGAF